MVAGSPRRCDRGRARAPGARRRACARTRSSPSAPRSSRSSPPTRWTDFTFSARNGVTYDPTRIAAQIVTGIGFLGAGAIIRQGLSVRGLTTAASLWVVAAIGMASGAGYYSRRRDRDRSSCCVSLWPLRILAHRALRAASGPASSGSRSSSRANESRVRPPRVARDARWRRAGVRGRGRTRPPPRRTRRCVSRTRQPRSGDGRADAPRAGARRAVGRLIRAILASANENKLRELRARARPAGRSSSSTRRSIRPRAARRYLRERARRRPSSARTLAPIAGCSARTRASRSRGSAAARACASARWAAGREAERALEELEGVQGDGRRARYVCELVALSPDGAEHRGTGVLEGRIAEELSGSDGFGFDPVFIPDGESEPSRPRQRLEAGHSHRARRRHALCVEVNSAQRRARRRRSPKSAPTARRSSAEPGSARRRSRMAPSVVATRRSAGPEAVAQRPPPPARRGPGATTASPP